MSRPSRTREQGVEQQEVAGAAGVDHAGLLEHRQQARGPGQGVGRAGAGRLGHRHQRPALVGRPTGAVGRPPGHGQDGPLHRALDRLPGQYVGGDEGLGQLGGTGGGVVDVQPVGQAPQQLAEDDPRVAAGAHERAVGDGPAGVGQVGVLESVQFG